MENRRTFYPLHVLKMLTEDDAASTLVRLFRSRHVADLQLIFLITIFLVISGPLFVTFWHKVIDSTDVIGSAALITAIVGTGSGMLTWIYQTGSRRLGVVDLFACEITTICTALSVAETALHLRNMYNYPPFRSMKFNSEEEYSPIFNNNTSDLEVLEARVVGRVTEFYTYFKAMRDYLRLAHDIEKPQDEIDKWRTLLRNGIYMLFLMLESGRKSIDVLVEYEPEQAQSTIIILISELVAYGMLLNYWECQASERTVYDAHLERLRMRKTEYPLIVGSIYRRVISPIGRDGKDRDAWQRAATLLGELKHRYCDVFGDWVEANASPAPLGAHQQ